MIIAWCIAAFVGFMTALFADVPDYTFPLPGAQFVSGASYAINRIMPLDVFIQVCTLLWALKLWLTIWGFVIWLYEKVPFKAS